MMDAERTAVTINELRADLQRRQAGPVGSFWFRYLTSANVRSGWR